MFVKVIPPEVGAQCFLLNVTRPKEFDLDLAENGLQTALSRHACVTLTVYDKAYEKKLELIDGIGA